MHLALHSTGPTLLPRPTLRQANFLQLNSSAIALHCLNQHRLWSADCRALSSHSSASCAALQQHADGHFTDCTTSKSHLTNPASFVLKDRKHLICSATSRKGVTAESKRLSRSAWKLLPFRISHWCSSVNASPSTPQEPSAYILTTQRLFDHLSDEGGKADWGERRLNSWTRIDLDC
jgi:hypothetical protein